MNSNTIAFSFNQLIKAKKDKYFKETTFAEKEKIISKFICDPEVSYNFLKMIQNIYEKNPRSDTFDTYEVYYNDLQYSLPKNKNKIFYEFLIQKKPNEINKYNSFKYLTCNDPINNFKNIVSKYSIFLDDIKNTEKAKKNLTAIDKYIDEMLQIYNINFFKYYFPPMKEYPIYVYNLYSFLFYKLLKRFRYDKEKNKFDNGRKVEVPYSSEKKIQINYDIGNYFNDIKILFEKFNYSNIDKDLITLKILIFYFQLFENSRDYGLIRDTFIKVINCINSTPMTSEILKRFKFYRENSEIPLEEKDWDDIKINEIIYIKYPKKFPVKIKYFRNELSKLDDKAL